MSHRARNPRIRPSNAGKGTFIGNLPPTQHSPSPPTPPTPSPPPPAAGGGGGAGAAAAAAAAGHAPFVGSGRMAPPTGQDGRAIGGPGGPGGGVAGGGRLAGGPNGSDAYVEPGGLPYSPREDSRYYPGIDLGTNNNNDVVGGGDDDDLTDSLNEFWREGGVAGAGLGPGAVNPNATFSPFGMCDEEADPYCIFGNYSFGNSSVPDNDSYYDSGNLTASNGTAAETFPPNYWTILLVIFPMFTVFGNVLVVMSVVREKSLKTVTNYFICSLAVADIMVAVVVMPFAVYVEVVGGWWLSDLLCDAWVASDVMACTASILNLTAISVDRFIAVTQPIKYSKHKNSKRVYIMIAITWIISVAIAMPISLGVNYSPDRLPGMCVFYNADFIIYSSMGSFYIPSIIMIFLYWKIYRVIHQRAWKAKKKAVNSRALQGVIENTGATAAAATAETAVGGATTGAVATGGGGGGGKWGGGGGGGGTGVGRAGGQGGNGAVVNSAQSPPPAPPPPPPPPPAPSAPPTVKTGLARMDNGRVTSYNTTSSSAPHHLQQQQQQQLHHHHHHQLAPPVVEDTSFTNMPSGSDSHNDEDDDDYDDDTASVRAPPTPDHATQLLTCKQHAHHQHHLQDGDLGAELIANPGAAAAEQRECQEGGSGGGSGASNEAETNFTSPAGQGGGGGRKRHHLDKDKNNCSAAGSAGGGSGGSGRQKKGVTKFNFHMRTSRKRKEKSSSRREKKATKTLAIVLGVFLLCWVPFFTINIIHAICIRYQMQEYPACNADPMLLTFFVWLGYINSFLNPLIYTIFNPEFRKAFRKILTDFCCCCNMRR